jgi:hypothetical protein
MAGGASSVSGFPMRISLAQNDPVMRPGLSVRVEVVRQSWPDALTVPRHAVQFAEGEASVRRKGQDQPTPVRLAGCTPVECVVESGLAEGDDVLVR